MTFSFDTLYITLAEMIFWTCIFCVILQILHRKKTLLYVNANIALIVYGACLLRVMLPIDLQYSRKINLPGAYSWLFERLFLNLYQVGPWKINLLFLFCLIWISGMAVLLIKYIAAYQKIRKKLFRHSCKWAVEKQAREKLPDAVFGDRNIQIRVCSLIQVPMASGLFQKVIFLPEEKYSAEQYSNILLHEGRHFRNHDLWIKMMIQIIRCVFWWNPLAILFSDRIDMLLEIRCDEGVTLHMDSKEKKEYLLSLMTVAGIERRTADQDVMPGITMFAGAEQKLLEERFEQIIRKKRIPGWKSNIGMILLLISAFFISYSIAPMPAFSPPVEEITGDGATEVKPADYFLFQSEDDTYYMVSSSDPDESYEIPKEFIEDYLEQGFELKDEMD